MALILDNDLLCIERGGRSYKWSGAELKSQITGLSPIAQITGTNPIVVSQQSRDATISINDATTGQKGATILTNTVDNTQTKALTPKGAKDQLDLKANLDGSNATGTWNINITGNSPGSDNSTNSVNSQNVLVDTDESSNATRYVTFVAGGGGSVQRRLLADSGLSYNPSTNSLSASTFTGNLNGTASSAVSATNAVNCTNATNSTNVNVLTDGTNAWRFPNFTSSVSGNQSVRADTGLQYNPSTNTLWTSGTFYGTTIRVDNYTMEVLPTLP